jgi:hypothetical protein
MTKPSVMIAACATLLCAVAALATPTPKQNCDNARITAWKVYLSCVDTGLAKDAKGVSFDHFAASAKCRHTYFKKWSTFQTKRSFAGSSCIGIRFTDNGDGSVTDNLTGLVWEKKTNDGSVHSEGNVYTWSLGSNNEDGTAFTSFLGALNGGRGFAGANGWRLPTLVELQTIVLDFACTGAGGGPRCSCSLDPCIDGTFGPTQSNYYWSATRYVPSLFNAWGVFFVTGNVNFLDDELSNFYVRAVRGGL